METPPENAQQEVSLTVTGQFFFSAAPTPINNNCENAAALRSDYCLWCIFFSSGSKGDLFCVFLVFCCAPVAAEFEKQMEKEPSVRCAPEINGAVRG
jgi:hypothetical protein